MNVEPYFGLTRTLYLQLLCNRWGDFRVSSTFTDPLTGEQKFWKKITVLEIWQTNPSRLEKVTHRQAMPNELFLELDHEEQTKFDKIMRFVKKTNLPYAVWKSRNGWHISLIYRHKPKQKVIHKVFNSLEVDLQFASLKHQKTWSLEWTQHWKDQSVIIGLVNCSSSYPRALLGGEVQ